MHYKSLMGTGFYYCYLIKGHFNYSQGVDNCLTKIRAGTIEALAVVGARK
jgi:hypothetical protein